MKTTPYKHKCYDRNGIHEESFVNIMTKPYAGSVCPHIIAYGETQVNRGAELVCMSSETFWSVEFFTGGTGSITFNGQKYGVKAGDVAIHQLTNGMSVFNTGKTLLTKKYLSIITVPEFNFFFHIPRNDIMMVRHRNPARVEELFSRMKSLIVTNHEYLREELAGLLYQCLLEVVNVRNGLDDGTEPSDIFRNIAFSPQYYPNVESLMKEFKLTHHGLYTFFRKKYNTTPMEYIIQKRLDNSIWHLENQTVSIAEIAKICGYKNLPFFSREFKKRYGISPREYRKGIEKGNIQAKTK